VARALEDQEVTSVIRPDHESPIQVEPSGRRVRVFFSGVAIADSKDMMLLLEHGHLPVYYFPVKDVRTDLLEATSKSTRCPHKGQASYWSIKVGERVAENAVWAYLEPIPQAAAIKDHMAFYWHKADAWFEEDDEVYLHPRDPYKRVDVLNSSRHVRIEVGGETVAETTRPRLLFETGLPTRYYIPKLDVRMDLLAPTDTKTRCPYKGQASYWTLNAGEIKLEDVAWSYPEPIPECPKIENLISFFNERVDIYVDGELQPRPKTHWS
jgi:uncharacterized protein (DUF427 family)